MLGSFVLTGTSVLLLVLVYLRFKIAFLIQKATNFLLSSFMAIIYSMYLIIYFIFLNFILPNISNILFLLFYQWEISSILAEIFNLFFINTFLPLESLKSSSKWIIFGDTN